MKPGTYWYRMEHRPDDGQLGYTRMICRPLDDGTISINWEMKLGTPGGSYEEERLMVIDSALRVERLRYAANDRLVMEVSRDGKLLIGEASRKDAKELLQLEIQAPDDAGSCILFALAAFIPLDEGTTYTRTELNEADALKKLGIATFVVGPVEEIEVMGLRKLARRVELKKPDGNRMLVWVNDEREIVEVDWGGNITMSLSPIDPFEEIKDHTSPGKPASGKAST